MNPITDTITALATARGRAALAIVRLSGPGAILTAAACFRGKDLSTADSHTAHVGFVQTPDGDDIDQVVLTVFKAPSSVTGEDVVEIACHGGDFAPMLIQETLVHHGARLAEPGEFTQRAFLNGKMDLAQAEAVADLIHASSSRAHRVSLAHLQGRYSEWLDRLRDELLELCAFIELEQDFSEEDVEFADRDRLETLLDRADKLLSDLLNSYQLGELLRDGVRVVIGGRPNAGKSTLLNALLGRDRAIVSAIPGTTRDEIEADTEIEGIRFRFVDTAGLRETSDAIEAEGVRRAHRSIEHADILLYVYDLADGLNAMETAFLQYVASRPDLAPILVGNKRDKVTEVTPPNLNGMAFVAISAKQGTHVTDALGGLVQLLLDSVAKGLSEADASPVVMNQRHRQHLHKALEAVRAARKALDTGLSGDMLTLDLRAALHELGAITGEITNEDVLDQIFSRFCIGK